MATGARPGPAARRGSPSSALPACSPGSRGARRPCPRTRRPPRDFSSSTPEAGSRSAPCPVRGERHPPFWKHLPERTWASPLRAGLAAPGGGHSCLRVTGGARESCRATQVYVPASGDGRGVRGQHAHLRSGPHQRAAVRESRVNQEDGGQRGRRLCRGSLRTSRPDPQAQEGAPRGHGSRLLSEPGVG